MTTHALTSTADPRLQGVITRVLDGLPLREAVKASGLTPELFHYHLSKDKAAAAAYARAVEIKADLLADEIVHLADGDGDPAKVRNQIQARQWLASKLYAKRYGERIDLNVTQTLDIGSTLAEARARIMRPGRDPGEVIDAQVIDIHSKNSLGLSDDQSSSPPAPLEPDIFS